MLRRDFGRQALTPELLSPMPWKKFSTFCWNHSDFAKTWSSLMWYPLLKIRTNDLFTPHPKQRVQVSRTLLVFCSFNLVIPRGWQCSNHQELNQSVKILNNYLDNVLQFGSAFSWEHRGFLNPFMTFYSLTVSLVWKKEMENKMANIQALPGCIWKSIQSTVICFPSKNQISPQCNLS